MSYRSADEMRALLFDYRQLDPTNVDASQAGYAGFVRRICFERVE